MSEKKYYVNFKSKLGSLSKQNLRELFKYTQFSNGGSDVSIPPILYFTGTSSQSWKKHFQMFKKKYNKAKDLPNDGIMSMIDLFKNYTYEFDFPENGILKWDEWESNNGDYDPTQLILDDNEVVNVDEQLLKDDLPVIESDLSQDPNFLQSIQESMDKLTASAFIWDDDNNEHKQLLENNTESRGGNNEVNGVSEDIITHNNNNNHNNHGDSSNDNNSISINSRSETDSEIPGNLSLDEFKSFQNIAHAEICAGLTHHSKSLNKALLSGDLNMSNIQAARLNVSGFYTTKMAYWKIDLDDQIVKLFKILEFQSDTNKIKDQLTQRLAISKRDLLKNKFIDKDGNHLKDLNYKLDEQRWGISNLQPSKRSRSEDNPEEKSMEPPKKKSRVSFDLSDENTAKLIADKFDMSDNESFIRSLNDPNCKELILKHYNINEDNEENGITKSDFIKQIRNIKKGSGIKDPDPKIKVNPNHIEINRLCKNQTNRGLDMLFDGIHGLDVKDKQLMVIRANQIALNHNNLSNQQLSLSKLLNSSSNADVSRALGGM